MASSKTTKTSVSENEKDAVCLKELKSALSDDLDKWKKQFPGIIDDRFLLHFLRGRKYNVEKAATSFKNYFNARTSSTYRELFSKIDEPDANIALTSGMFRVFKERDEKDRQLIFLNFAFWPDNLGIDEFIRAFIYLAEECWNCPRTEKQGMVLLVDLGAFGMRQLAVFHPYNVYKTICLFWSNMPLRYSTIHLLNAGSIFGLCLSAARHLMPKKFRDRLKTHPTNYSELHKDLSPSKLPECLGGGLSEEDAYDTDFILRIFGKGEYYKKFLDKCGTGGDDEKDSTDL